MIKMNLQCKHIQCIHTHTPHTHPTHIHHPSIIPYWFLFVSNLGLSVMAGRRKHIEQGDTPDKPASKRSVPSSRSSPSGAIKKSLEFAVSRTTCNIFSGVHENSGITGGGGTPPPPHTHTPKLCTSNFGWQIGKTRPEKKVKNWKSRRKWGKMERGRRKMRKNGKREGGKWEKIEKGRRKKDFLKIFFAFHF